MHNQRHKRRPQEIPQEISQDRPQQTPSLINFANNNNNLLQSMQAVPDLDPPNVGVSNANAGLGGGVYATPGGSTPWDTFNQSQMMQLANSDSANVEYDPTLMTDANQSVADMFNDFTFGGEQSGWAMGQFEGMDLFFDTWLEEIQSGGNSQIPTWQDYSNWWYENMDTGQGNSGLIGGAGDLGFGGTSGAGYTSSETWTPGGMTGQDLVNSTMCDNGPINNSAGVCIACCE